MSTQEAQQNYGAKNDLSISVSLRKHDATLVASISTGTVWGTYTSGERQFITVLRSCALLIRPGIQCLQTVVGYDIIWAEVADGHVVISYLDRAHKGKSKLVVLKANIIKDDENAQQWCEAVMSIAYKGTKR